jgi:hypothetical protein
VKPKRLSFSTTSRRKSKREHSRHETSERQLESKLWHVRRRKHHLYPKEVQEESQTRIIVKWANHLIQVFKTQIRLVSLSTSPDNHYRHLRAASLRMA